MNKKEVLEIRKQFSPKKLCDYENLWLLCGL